MKNKIKCIMALFYCFAIFSSALPLSVAAGSGDSDAVIYDLTVDDTENPVGIDNKTPRFAWKMYSETVGQKQTAYKITVTDGDNTVWDSGKVESDISVGIKYGGSPLKSSTDYAWFVTVWDKDGKTSISDTAFFETALLEENAWSDADWISYDAKYTTGASLVPSAISNIAVGTTPDGWSIGANSAVVNADPDGDGNAQNMLKLSNDSGETTVAIPLSQSDFYAEITVDIKNSEKLYGMLDFGVGETSMSSQFSLALPKRTSSEHYPKASAFMLKSGSTTKYLDKKATFGDTFTELTMGLRCIDGALTAYYNGECIGSIAVASSAKTDGACKLYLSTDWATVYIKELTVNALTVADEDKTAVPVYRKTFTVKENLVSAKLYTSALGVYDTMINANRVGNVLDDGTVIYDELKPGFTEPSGRKFYSTYDITTMLNSGKNVITAEVTSGWYTGGVVATYKGNETAFLAKIILTYADGSAEVINTDTSWKSAKASPIDSKTGIYDGETYDATTDLSYRNADFDDSSWGDVHVNTEFKGIITAYKGTPVRVREDLQRNPQTLKKYTSSDIVGAKSGHYGTIDFKNSNVFTSIPQDGITISSSEKLIVDFGQNGSGWEKFAISAPKGTVITVRHSEALCESNGSTERGNCAPEGGLYTTSNRGAAATTRYTASGNGTELYNPRHTFYGFRYIEISVTDTVTLYDISAQTVTSVYSDTGTIVTDNDDLNRLINNVRWSMYSNFLSVPTDCPQRNERQGWTGDIQIFTQTANYLGFSKSFLAKFMDDMRDTMKRSNKTAFPSIAPDGIYGNGFGCTGWTDAGIIIPYLVYEMYGDIAIVEDNWDLMSGYLTYLENLGPFLELDDNARRNLIRYCGHLSLEFNADIWSDNGVMDGETEKIQTSIAYYAYDALLMSQMATALGKEDEAEKYRKVYEKQKQYYIDNFVNEDGTIKANTQQSCLFALYVDLLPNQASVDAVANQLISNISKHGMKLQTGFLGTGILLPTLTKIGRSDVAYSLLLSHDYPSWLYAVDHGATTMWERWDTFVEEKGWNNSGMNSLNHYAYGCVVGWMFDDVAGIGYSTENTGYKSVVFEPNPDISLKNVSASYDSAYGTVKAAYTYNGSNLFYAVTVSANSNSTVKLPVNEKYLDTIRVNGKSVSELSLENDGVVYQKFENGRAVFSTVSGSFVFSVNTDENTSVFSTVNTYDESEVTYTSTECSDKHTPHSDGVINMKNTTATSASGESRRLTYHATIEQTTDMLGNATYAVKFPNVQGYTNGYPRSVLVYDSNASGLQAFKTVKGQTYTVTLKYRLDSFASGKDINLQLRAGKISENIMYSNVVSYGNITSTPITTADEKGIWKTASLTFTANSDDYLHVVAVTTEYSDKNWGTSNTEGLELWLDDIEVTSQKGTLVCHDINGKDSKTVSVGRSICYSALAVPTRSGFEFCGWYLDSTKSIPAIADERITAEEVWAKWKSLEPQADIVSVMTYDENGFAYSSEEGMWSSGRGYVSNKLTVGKKDWLSIRAGIVTQNDGTNAMAVQRVTSSQNAAPTTIKLYNPENFNLYTVEVGKTYTINIKYKLLSRLKTNDAKKWDSVYFQLRKNQSDNSGAYSYVSSQQYADTSLTPITVNTAVGEWISAKLSFTATETTTVEIAVVANYAGGTWDNIDGNGNDDLKANIDMLIDNIEICRANNIEPENVVSGDINDDNIVNICDLVAINRAYEELDKKTLVCDVDKNRTYADKADLTAVRKTILKVK